MQKKFSFSITIIIFLCLSRYAPDCFATQWAKTYGGSNNDGFGANQSCASIQQTNDGGYIVASTTQSFGSGFEDWWILKLDSDGTVAWQKTYGGMLDDRARSVQQTTDGGYIAAGWTQSFGDYDIWILKLDSRGDVIWQKKFDLDADDRAASIQQTSEGGYIVAGWSYSSQNGNDVCILKLNSNGTVSWVKTYGDSLGDRANFIQQTSDKGYIVAGQTTRFGDGHQDLDQDMWILKLDSVGSVTWQKWYGGGEDDIAHSITQTMDGGYIVVGETKSFGDGHQDIWILKLDSEGGINWQKRYTSSDVNSWSTSIQQTSDGGYVVAGYEGNAVLILNLGSEGEIDWEKTKTYGGISNEWARSIQRTIDGGYIIAGVTQSFGAGNCDVWILKLDSNGNINNCDIVGASYATAEETSAYVVSSNAILSSFVKDSENTSVIPNSQAEVQVQEQCFAPNWFVSKPPTQDKLNGVWGYVAADSTHQFYAVGENGSIFHFNGTSWSTTGLSTPQDLYGIWGNAENGDITVLYAVGDNATIVRFDGSDWTDLTPIHGLPNNNNLKDVWGSSAGDVFVVGDGGFIAHYDGNFQNIWSQITPSPTPENLKGIWGSSSDNYVAVGEGGTVVKYDGLSWQASNPTSNDLSEVWGSASDDIIYAVGKSGTIIRYYDGSWSEVESPTAANLRGIWGSSENSIFAVGEIGTILYYNGTNWRKLDSGSQNNFISTFGTLNPRVMIVGYDGTIQYGINPSIQGRVCNSCTGGGISNVTVDLCKNQECNPNPEQTRYTDEKGVFKPFGLIEPINYLRFTDSLYYDLVAYLNISYTSGALFDYAAYLLPKAEPCISGMVTKKVFIESREVYKGVQNMEVKLYKDSTQVASTLTDSGGNYSFIDFDPKITNYNVRPVITCSEFWPDPAEHAITFPITDQYDFELIYAENQPAPKAYWTEDYVAKNGNVLLNGIWGSAPNNIFVVGNEGTILRHESSWGSQTSGTTNNLKGVWGNQTGTAIYVVGAGGKVLKTIDNGEHWTPMVSNTTKELNAVWGSADNNIFAVGESGTIRHYDGDGDNNGSPDDIWEIMTSGTTVKLLGVWGNSATGHVYAVGNSDFDDYWKRTVLHYYEGSWHTEDAGNGVPLMSSWGSSATDIKSAGSFGGLIEYNGTGWKQTGGPTEKTFNAMWGSSSTNIFAVGYGGVIAHYDGTRWSIREPKPTPPATPDDLYGVWGVSSPIRVYAVGDNGKIYSYNGDVDGDGVDDNYDSCPDVYNPGNADGDEDGVGDACDNCLNTANGPLMGTCINANIGANCTDDEICGFGGICSKNQENSDHDDWGNACDNCPSTINEGQEDADEDGVGDACDNCPNNANPDQADTFPRGGNSIGDACDCEGNFDCDLDVDGTDASTFKGDFGRNGFNSPCTFGDPCNGDFTCDGDVDGTDASKFKSDFGRGQFKNPCPSCMQGELWCVY